MAHRRAGGLRRGRGAGGRRTGLGIVAIAPSAVCRRHRHAARASRSGRVHALHVALLRSHRAFVRRAAAAAAMAAITLLVGPAVSWVLRLKQKQMAASTTLALTCALFLVAAHIAPATYAARLISKLLGVMSMAPGSPAVQFIIDPAQSYALWGLF